jgi:hypothetical protein
LRGHPVLGFRSSRIVLLGSVGVAALAGLAHGGVSSPLAMSMLGGGSVPTLVVAQRVIDRSWGPSEDSVYVEMEIPGWRSEAAALGLSAAVPGLGQAYAGESRRGLWFVLAEAAGWTANLLYRHRGHQLRDQASTYAGAPSDSQSTWSFARWAHASEGDPSELEALYNVDREVFYDLIASDPRYLAGWSGNPAETREYFSGLRRAAEARLRYARYAAVELWLNHVAAAVDALRLARIHNLPLRPNLSLNLKSGWGGGGPTLQAAVERRF